MIKKSEDIVRITDYPKKPTKSASSSIAASQGRSASRMNGVGTGEDGRLASMATEAQATKSGDFGIQPSDSVCKHVQS